MTRRDPSQDVPYDRDLIRSGRVAPRDSHREREASRQPSGRYEPEAGRRPEYRPPYRPARRRSAGGTIARVFSILLVAVLLVAVLLGVRAAAFNASVSTALFPSTALLGPLNGSERVNVLLVGYGGADHGGAYLADSIQIMSIDPATDTTTTIPIPRDLWIEGVSSYPDNGKVNEVFSRGEAAGGLEEAGRLMAEVLSDVTGLDIEHWISIDFEGFVEMVDAVGGVTVDNPTAFSYTTNEAQHAAGDWTTGGFEAGEIHLDGEQALAYSRARYTSVITESNDFARSVRQARILAALRDEMGGGGITAIIPGLRLMDAMEGHVLTDVSVIDLYLLSSHLASDRRVELTEGPVLTATRNTVGQYILVPTGWIGPGSYSTVREHLDRELRTDAP